jgi:hypothetical protein
MEAGIALTVPNCFAMEAGAAITGPDCFATEANCNALKKLPK